jgi:uncharacterized protein
MSAAYDAINDYVQSLEIIDTHEHLPYREDQRDRNTDVLKEYLQHYFSRDLMSAGLSAEEFQKVIDPKGPLMKRWEIVEPYWTFARRTGYGRALDLSVKELYGIDGIHRSTISRLNDEFLKTLGGGQYRKVLKETCRIRMSILDSNLDCDQTWFRSTVDADALISPRTRNDLLRASKDTGVSLSSFEDWLEVSARALEAAYVRGAVCLKSSLAYTRTLSYERPTRAAAEEAFNAFFSLLHFPDWDTTGVVIGKPFQDYMMHFVLHEANRKKWTFQFHTGLQEGCGNYIANSDPTLLSNLFLEYPDVQFDVFHIGYPYQQVLSALAKTFPNVFIDMCWAHIISPTACIRALCEWIDSVPFNKISAFGGDYCFIDGVAGHQQLARRNVSIALAEKVDEDVCDIEEARRIAKALFFDNPARIFHL